MLVESVLFKHMNEQRCEHLNTTTGPAPLLYVNIFVFFHLNVFVLVHMNVFVSPL